ncbi:hypothetical protein AVEN_218834-1 [Araneus ventricosus]|uniref:Uncharacterized protein n=1 Tax=Araneus ventricosus TaxID=182803 RepID=A0A4Y2HRY3_ARAVE|nr:hypothetical protein AVEN_218834-1 [Araneus ventricosus]
MLPVKCRQLENVKGELLKLTKKETMAQRSLDKRAEETEEKINSRLSDMAQRGYERRAEETEGQRNSRLSAMVGGSIGISNTVGTVTESREDSIANEESALEKTSRRRAIEKTVVWKTFKSFVFLICLIFLIMQSVEFFNIYYKYPTTIVLETTVAEEFKQPAITLCFRNTISFKEFCSYEPDQCEKPRNMEEFCRKHVFDCSNGTTNSKIPMQDERTRDIMQRYLFNDSYNDARLFKEYEYASKARTFIENYMDDYLYIKCFSDNLHLYQSRSEPETQKFDFNKKDRHLFSVISLYHTETEPFYPPDEPQVFVGIHSPYVPIDFADLHAIRPGELHDIYVQLASIQLFIFCYKG